jgi:hypothetical protein
LVSSSTFSFLPPLQCLKKKIENNQEKTEAAIRISQEETKSSINPNRSRLDETIRHLTEDVLVSVGKRTQGLREEFNDKNEQTQTNIVTLVPSLYQCVRTFSMEVS